MIGRFSLRRAPSNEEIVTQNPNTIPTPLPTKSLYYISYQKFSPNRSNETKRSNRQAYTPTKTHIYTSINKSCLPAKPIQITVLQIHN